MFPASHSKEKCNAKTYPINCKYCGESVYYFSCDCGSGVFFEELGVPWPRHDCHAGEIRMTKTELKRVESQFERAKLVLEGVQTAHRAEIEHLTETIERLENILEFAKHRKNELEESLVKTGELLEDTKEEPSKDFHREPGIPGEPLSGPQTITIKFKKYSLTAKQVADLKRVYNTDRKRNPSAGPTRAIKEVLVKPGIIPQVDIKYAFNGIARIVGHLKPFQKRAANASQGGSK